MPITPMQPIPHETTRYTGPVRGAGYLFCLVVMTALMVQPAAVFAADAGSMTGALSAPPMLHGEFLKTYQKYGLSVIGYPLSDELNEGGTTVQYFERVKMEYHPELAAKGTPVLFSRLGAEISAGSPFGRVEKVASTRQRWYFGQTAHSVAEPFLSFWRDRGGVALFGYPISEVVQQDGMQVQWFERARMEYHTEPSAQGRRIQLTLLGKIAFSRRLVATPVPAALPLAKAEAGLSSQESSLLAGINAERARAGQPPVAINVELTRFARSRSNDMASRNYFAHFTPEGKGSLDMLKESGVAFSIAGEILAMNNAPDAETANMALNTFLQSPPHHEIMLEGRYMQVGVGHVKAANGQNYFTVVFIR